MVLLLKLLKSNIYFIFNYQKIRWLQEHLKSILHCIRFFFSFIYIEKEM